MVIIGIQKVNSLGNINLSVNLLYIDLIQRRRNQQKDVLLRNMVVVTTRKQKLLDLMGRDAHVVLPNLVAALMVFLLVCRTIEYSCIKAAIKIIYVIIVR